MAFVAAFTAVIVGYDASVILTACVHGRPVSATFTHVFPCPRRLIASASWQFCCKLTRNCQGYVDALFSFFFLASDPFSFARFICLVLCIFSSVLLVFLWFLFFVLFSINRSASYIHAIAHGLDIIIRLVTSLFCVVYLYHSLSVSIYSINKWSKHYSSCGFTQAESP